MAELRPGELADFPVVIELPVQWGEQDAFGHVNNAVFFRWYESARIAYLTAIGLTKEQPEEPGPILAAIACDYLQQLRFPDRVLIGTRVPRIGNTSLATEHAVYSTAQRRLVARGTSTIVLFDYAAQRSFRVPDALRAAIAQLEGRPELQSDRK